MPSQYDDLDQWYQPAAVSNSTFDWEIVSASNSSGHESPLGLPRSSGEALSLAEAVAESVGLGRLQSQPDECFFAGDGGSECEEGIRREDEEAEIKEEEQEQEQEQDDDEENNGRCEEEKDHGGQENGGSAATSSGGDGDGRSKSKLWRWPWCMTQLLGLGPSSCCSAYHHILPSFFYHFHAKFSSSSSILAAMAALLLLLAWRWRRLLAHNTKLRMQISAQNQKISQLMLQLLQLKDSLSKIRNVPIIIMPAPAHHHHLL